MNKVYLVIASEEDFEYVARVFKDKQKAEDYARERIKSFNAALSYTIEEWDLESGCFVKNVVMATVE